MQEQRLRVVIADDQRLMRAGLRTILEATHDIEVIGEAEDGVGAVRMVEEKQPDVILMDIRMPLRDGIEATELLRSQPATQATRILLLTTFDMPELILQGMRAGAAGYLLKDCSAEELCHAIRTVARGQILLQAPSVAQLFSGLLAPATPTPLSLQTPAEKIGLTSREMDVLRLIMQGHTNAEISETLYVSESTIKTHINHLFAKMGARDRAHAIVLAHEQKLV
jgi:DNA-binding NarL/FixJ family response regulator